MKNTVLFLMVATTMVLIALTIMAAMDFTFIWLFYGTVLGQIMLVFLVFKVLMDNYTTDKTFEDFYEDYPKGNEIN